MSNKSSISNSLDRHPKVTGRPIEVTKVGRGRRVVRHLFSLTIGGVTAAMAVPMTVEANAPQFPSGPHPRVQQAQSQQNAQGGPSAGMPPGMTSPQGTSMPAPPLGHPMAGPGMMPPGAAGPMGPPYGPMPPGYGAPQWPPGSPVAQYPVAFGPGFYYQNVPYYYPSPGVGQYPGLVPQAGIYGHDVHPGFYQVGGPLGSGLPGANRNMGSGHAHPSF